MAELWNTHNIQAQKRLEVHGGKPDIMYFTPDYADGLEEVVQLIKPNYVAPSNANNALRLYCEIIDVLKNY